MNSTVERARGRLLALLDLPGPAAVAVSGGVDSMTLAVLAGRTARDVTMCHAVSPAVPPEASARVRAYAAREGWRLTVLDAGEFEDPRYRSNPLERCYFCKTNLYGAMHDALATRAGCMLLSGTNTDDLRDFRPGLAAAAEHRVRHPYVEAGIDKATVRAIARAYALHDLAELPAAPCLSSRVQTGIAIDARDLAAIHAVETWARDVLRPRTVRCRVRDSGVVIELDPPTLERVLAPRAGVDPAAPAEAACEADPPTGARALRARARAAFAGHRPGIGVRLAPYSMGSAFVRSAPAPGPR